MTRTALASVLSAILLAACGGSGTAPETPGPDAAPDSTEISTPASDPALTPEEALVPSPFDTLLPWNSDAEAVQTTESGIQYLILREGTEDGLSPTDRDTVTVMYDGRLPDGTKFDSSYDRRQSATFPLNGVIAGWTEGLQLMSEGDEFMFYIPSELGYGQNPRPGGVIKPGDDLIFRVELEKVRQAPPPKEVDAEAWSTHLPWNSDHPDVKKTGSGLEFVVLATGAEDGLSPEGGETVVVHYEGRLVETGETFDSSFERGEAAMFPANRLIPGWVEALQLMKPGDRWMLFIPSSLAYGEGGTPGGPIPPNADLMFEVEMMDVLKTQ